MICNLQVQPVFVCKKFQNFVIKYSCAFIMYLTFICENQDTFCYNAHMYSPYTALLNSLF